MAENILKANKLKRPVLGYLLLFAVSYGTSLLLSSLFLADFQLRLILSVPSTILLLFGIHRFIRSRQQSDRKEQYRVVLSYFLAQAGIGRSLEQSLLTARSALACYYPPRHPFYQMLLLVERQILANQTSSSAIDILVQSLDCMEATIGLGILRKIALSGNSLLAYLRQASQSLADLIEITRDIASQNARTSAESGILAIMPFIMTALLRQSSDYLEQAQSSPAGKIAFGAAFLVSILAVSIIPGIMTPATVRGKPKGTLKNEKKASKAIIPASAGLRQVLTRILGNGNSLRTDEALFRIHDESSLSRNRHDVQKVHYLIVGVLLGILFAFSLNTPLVIPFPPVILIFCQDQLLFRKAKQEELQLLSSYPFFLHICVSLLGAGLTVHHVLSLVSGAFSEMSESRVRTPMVREAQKISQSLRAGLPVDQVLDLLAIQSTTSELRSAYQLLGRYSQLGGQDLLQQLLQQTKVCWATYRNASRSQMDEQSMKMMLPMMLDLIVILIVSITPALIFMGSSL